MRRTFVCNWHKNEIIRIINLLCAFFSCVLCLMWCFLLSVVARIIYIFYARARGCFVAMWRFSGLKTPEPNKCAYFFRVCISKMGEKQSRRLHWPKIRFNYVFSVIVELVWITHTALIHPLFDNRRVTGGQQHPIWVVAAGACDAVTIVALHWSIIIKRPTESDAVAFCRDLTIRMHFL